MSFRAIPAMLLHTRMLLSRNQNFPWSSYVSCSVELGPNQVCTLFGARSGSITVSGRDYLKDGYGLDTDDLWRRNIIVLFVLFAFFSLTQTFVIEIFPVSTARITVWMLLIASPSGQQLVGGGGIGFFAKDTPETKKLNEKLKAHKLQKAEDEKQEKIRAMEGIKRKRDSYVC